MLAIWQIAENLSITYLLTYLNHTASKAIGNHADKHKVQHKGKHTCVVCESVVVMHGILLNKELVIKDFSSINKN